MSFLLSINQYEKSDVIGVFESENTLRDFIESIPFVKKAVVSDQHDGVNYFMDFDDVPDYYEVNYRNYVYVISRFSFVPDDGEIDFVWHPVHRWDESVTHEKRFIEGDTAVDAYRIPNHEAAAYILKREELAQALEQYFSRKGSRVRRDGLGSQDGEYISVAGEPSLYLLDADAVEVWQESADVEDFICKYRQFLASL